MKISRTRFRLVWLTLIAFGVQLGVAASHHHHDINRGVGFAARAITAGLCAPTGKGLCNQNPSKHDHDGCVLCWAAAMASNSLAPSLLPQVPAPSAKAGTRLNAPDAPAVDRIHRDHFQARAPPSTEAA